MNYAKFKTLNEQSDVDLSRVSVGDMVKLANGAVYEVGDTREVPVEDQYGGELITYLFHVGTGADHPWGYENYTEVIGGGRYFKNGTNSRHPYEGSGISIIDVVKT